MAESTTPYVGFARKWRPQDFLDLEGQDQVAKALRSEIEKGRIGHAYIFSGPRGVGKTSSARILAKAVNCIEGPTATPCGHCGHCVSIANGSNLDVIEIDGASNNGVDQVRDLRDSVNHVPFSCRYKIYIIDEVHMLSIAAFNALLKTLEEPPSYVMFIFATTEAEKIPDTIKSRCQGFKFRAITIEDIVHRLNYIIEREQVEVDASERQLILETIAISAEGGMRDAQVALDQVISLSQGALRLQDVRDFLGVADQASLFHVVENIRDRQTTPLLELVRDMVERGRDLERFVKQMLAFLRDLLIIRYGASDDLVRLSMEGLKRARDLAASTDPAVLVNAVNVFLDLEARMKQGSSPRFLLEFALLRLSALEDVAAIGDLVRQLESGGGGAPARPATPQASPAPAKPRPVRYETADAAPATTQAAASGSWPLAGGGALEPADASDIAPLRELLMKTVRERDLALSRSLHSAPLQAIEGNVAYFGLPGQAIGNYDLKRLEKPESKAILCEALKMSAGGREWTIKFGSPARLTASPTPAVVVAAHQDKSDGSDGSDGSNQSNSATATASLAAAPSLPVSAPVSVTVERSPIIQPDEGEIEAEGEESFSADILEVGIADARRAYGKKGLSAARIRRMLEENPPLREKVELVRKIFGGEILDGENRPVKM